MAIDITSLTEDASIEGTEVMPASDGGTPVGITPALLKTYIINAIEAISAGMATTTADSVFILQGGAMKPLAIDTLVAYAVSVLWGKATAGALAGANLVQVQQGGVEKTVSLTNLSAFVNTTEKASILNLATLTAGTSVAGTDVLLFCNGTTPKQITVTNFLTSLWAGFAAYVTALSAVTASAGTDVFYCLQGGVEKKATLTQMFAGINVTIPPSSTTENKIPQWDSTSKTLKDGLVLSASIPEAASASDSNVPTEKAVRTLVDSSINSVSQLDIDGATDIGDALADADLVIVDDGAGGTNRKSAISRFWTYIWGKFTAATAKTTPVDGDGIGIVDSAASNVIKLLTFANMWTNYLAAKVSAVIATIIPSAVDGTLATGANADFAPTKLVYNKTCADSDGDDVIDLHDGTVLGQILTIYLGTQGGTDNAVITPVTALSYSTITLDAANEIATLQWQGATVGWAILYTNGTVS